MNTLPRALKNTVSLLIPAVYLGIVLLYDWEAEYETISPPLLSIGLLLFSLVLGPIWICCWGTIYSLVVMQILLNPQLYALLSAGNLPAELHSHKFRLVGFICTASFACLFSYLLTATRKSRDTLNQVILSMPLPVIISDIEGNILHLNEKTRSLLELGETNEYPNYFDALAPKMKQGKCISAYLSLFQEGVQNGAKEGTQLQLEIEGQPIIAQVSALNTKPRQLVTILSGVG